MKVCMLGLNKFTHDTRVHKEASTLAGAGYDTTVWALGGDDLPNYQELEGFKVKRWIPSKDAILPGLMYLEQNLCVFRRLYQEKSDVYHAHDVNALIPCYLASTFNKAHLVYDLHELWVANSGTRWQSKIRLATWKPEKQLSPRAASVITVNTSIAQLLNDLYNVNPVVISNFHRYEQVEKTDILHEELGIQKNVESLYTRGP